MLKLAGTDLFSGCMLEVCLEPFQKNKESGKHGETEHNSLKPFFRYQVYQRTALNVGYVCEDKEMVLGHNR